CSTDREAAEAHNLERVTPGHPLFEALRRHTLALARETFAAGACFWSLKHEFASRIDFYRAKAVDGLGQVIHERLFAVESNGSGGHRLVEPVLLGDLVPAKSADAMAPVADTLEIEGWLHANALDPFLSEIRDDRAQEVDRISTHVELSLTELLQKADEEIGRAFQEKERNVQGAEGRLAQAESRHEELHVRRERRRQELKRQRAVSLQGVERITSVAVLPHPERESPEVRRLRPDFETEATAMRVVMEYECAQGRAPTDVHEKNLGYDITSLDPNSGELRLIEVKGIGAATGRILLTPNERRVAEDRRDCYWLYVVTHCDTSPKLEGPIKDPARIPWHEVVKVQHYWLDVDAAIQPVQVKQERADYTVK
ncbi:MAG: protein NO VEIN domain-containing protein, partial [Pyrinomonadaceae bacterium]